MTIDYCDFTSPYLLSNNNYNHNYKLYTCKGNLIFVPDKKILGHKKRDNKMYNHAQHTDVKKSILCT